MKDDPRPLHVAFLGPLTDMAAAILLEPRIVNRNVRVVWIGGGVWPVGGQEYNLSNDIASANVVFRSGIEIWQIPKPLYRVMAVSYAELRERVEPHGRIGKYLVDQLIELTPHRPEPLEHRSLGDSPAIGVMMYPECGQSDWRAGARVQRADELRAHGPEPSRQGLHRHRPALHPRGLLRQTRALQPRREGIREVRRVIMG